HACVPAAGTGVDLRLHDAAGAAHFGRPVDGLLGAVGDAALRNGDAEARQQRLGLILVDVHGYLRVGASVGAPVVRAAMAAAISTMFCAIRAEAASIMRPSSWAAPRPARAASSSASRMRRARSTSAGGGVNTSLASASW